MESKLEIIVEDGDASKALVKVNNTALIGILTGLNFRLTVGQVPIVELRGVVTNVKIDSENNEILFNGYPINERLARQFYEDLKAHFEDERTIGE